MAFRAFPAALLFSSLSVMSVFATSPVQAGVQPTFSCAQNLGAPTTMVYGPNGAKPFIRWTSSQFSASGWSPERRCMEVSKRLQDAKERNALAFITTGNMNGLPVICTAREKGGSCDVLLYTLKPGQDPVLTLRSLLNVRSGVAGPISETTARIYVDVEEIIAR
jgi:hypothetical protein